MLKTILLILGITIAAVLLYAATKPDAFKVQRSATIAAAADKLFPLINDTHAFNTWNPYARMDPAMKLRYEGTASGPGAAYAWESDKVGVGRMEVLESTAPSRAVMRLDFEKPMKATNRVEFKLEAQGIHTQVTWTMTGPMPYLSKVITLFFSMDKMVGRDFEAGLVNLKTLAERG
jgi:Polyketide cyclase / dehydrase and lipid transport